MLIGSQVMPGKMSAATTARLDRELAGCDRKNWLRDLIGKIHVASIWRIPIGFEDETGFHLGAQQVPGDHHVAMERAVLFESKKDF